MMKADDYCIRVLRNDPLETFSVSYSLKNGNFISITLQIVSSVAQGGDTGCVGWSHAVGS